MKNTLRQVLRSPKFMLGFSIIAVLLLMIIIYPLIVPGNPLEMIGLGTFFKPGTYVSVYDSIDASVSARPYVIKLSGAGESRVAAKLLPEDRVSMQEWLLAYGIPAEEIDIEDTEALLGLWWGKYSDDASRELFRTQAARRAYTRLNAKLDGVLESEPFTVMTADPETGELAEFTEVADTAYVNVADVANVRVLPLGTDNFGRDVLKELMSALGTSLWMGLLAGAVATLIGLFLGLISGYVGGWLDDIIMFVNNLFTVIPNFVLLILISFSLGQSARGATTVAIVIGLTSWVWTARSVRSQVISLRNRDHVNLSKLSGHSLMRIIVTDILPYIASYVVMAFILQVSSAILAEASLSLLGLGPKTTEIPTLGIMMNWAMMYTAHLNGAWWAYYPVILVIAFVSFALNLMNTGLDQVFNPQLRD
jgi:peptide/nickel transport system permease protein